MIISRNVQFNEATMIVDIESTSFERDLSEEFVENVTLFDKEEEVRLNEKLNEET